MHPRPLVAVLALAAQLAACGGPGPLSDATASDGTPDAAAEAAPGDAPPDLGAEPRPEGGVDAPPEASPPDAAPEGGGPDAAPDVTADAGGADAAPTFPSLATEYASAMYQVLYAPCRGAGCSGERSVVMGPTSCMVTRSSRTVNFSTRACSPASAGGTCDTLTGRGPTMAGGPVALITVIDGSGGPTSSSTVSVIAGTRYFVGSTPRQNFHVQFAATATATLPGATGIAGRTVDPTRGDLWLLGCPTD